MEQLTHALKQQTNVSHSQCQPQSAELALEYLGNSDETKTARLTDEVLLTPAGSTENLTIDTAHASPSTSQLEPMQSSAKKRNPRAKTPNTPSRPKLNRASKR